MEENTPPDIFQLLIDLAAENSDFEKKWEDIYKDSDNLYLIRLKYPDDFYDISRISLDDREHATDCGRQILNGLIDKLTVEYNSNSIDQAQKRFIRRCRMELQTQCNDYNYLETFKQKLKEELELYSTFAEPDDSSSCLPVVPETAPTAHSETGSASCGRKSSYIRERPGVCIIMDHIDIPEDVTVLKELFIELGYETKQIEPEKDRMSKTIIQDYLRTDTKVHDRSAIVIVLDVAYRDGDDEINGYQHVFDDCNKLKDKPKILITHLYHGDPVKQLNLPPNGIVHILSHITDDKTGDSLFIKSLDAVFRKHYRTCDMYELLTKVLRNVEIPQHIKLKDVELKQRKYPLHSVIFKSSLKSAFRIGTTHTDILDDPLLSSTGFFSLLPAQYKRLGRISRYDLKRVCSIDIDLKVTSTFDNHDYRMDRKPRGLCVIVNMSNARLGSLVDEIKMAQLFEELYFDVRIINNRTHEEIEQEIKALASKISSLHQCLVVFIMGHGTTVNKVHQFADVTNTMKSSHYVLDVFKNQKHLRRKPKMFIIQTCFGGEAIGEHYAKSMEHVEFDTEDSPSETVQQQKLFAVHKDSDTIQLNATLEDYMSYRTPLEGSYLIQGVDQVLREYSAEKDVTQLMTLIKNEVLLLGIERKSPQQARVEDTQNLHLYLNPGYSVPEQFPLPDISPCEQMCEEGSVVWTAAPGIACVADRCNIWIKLVNIETGDSSVYQPQDPGNVSGILSGVSVRGRDDKHPHKHVIIVKGFGKLLNTFLVQLRGHTWQKLAVVSEGVETGNYQLSRTQKSIQNYTVMRLDKAQRASGLFQDEPLTLCAVNDDAFAVLTGRRESSECMIHVYSPDDIHYGDIYTTGARLTLKCIPEIESHKLCIGIRDKVCYSNTKFYISCFITSRVLQLDIHGNIDHIFGEIALGPDVKTPGTLYRPCGLYTYQSDNSESVIICCFNGIHYGSIIQKGDGTWQTEWLLFTPLLNKTHAMCYSNGKVLTTTYSGLDYTSLSSAPNLEVSSSAKLTPNHTHHFNSQLVQTVWSTLDPDIVAVGSAESAHIFLLRSDGELLATRFIDMEARIMSGINLYGNKHLTVLHDQHKNYVWHVHLTGEGDGVLDLDKQTYIDKIYMAEENTLLPISLLTVDSDHYGVLCRVRSKTAVIQIIERTTLIRKKKVLLDVIDVGINDRVCVDMNCRYMITSYDNNLLYMFDMDGTLLAKIDTPGLNPCSVMVDKNNYILVQCQDSLYKRANSSSRDCDWNTIIDRPSWDVCSSSKNVYTVYKHSLNVYQPDNLHQERTLLGLKVTPEKKNPPLISYVDQSAILEGDPIIKYHCPSMWPTLDVRYITYDRSINIDFEPLTSWSLHNNECIIVGGCSKDKSATLSVVTASGQHVTHGLSCGREVISGVLVKKGLHIVCVAYDGLCLTSRNKIHIITLDPTSTDSSIIHPLFTIDVTNPVHAFRKSKRVCGVLCVNDTFADGTIRLLDLNPHILSTCIEPHTRKSPALWIRRTIIYLDLPNPHPYDTVAVTPRGQYCIASYSRDEILVYSGTGRYIYTLGESRIYNVHLGRLSRSRTLHCTADNKLLITGLYGDIQMYNMNSETGRLVIMKSSVLDDGDKLSCCDRIYKWMNKDNDVVYDKAGKRKVYYLKHDPVGWTIIREEHTGTRVTYSTVTKTKIWDINSDSRIYLYNLHTNSCRIWQR